MRRTASIVIPTHNRAHLLRTALDSVQNLETPPHWQIEIIVVDNVSTDETKLAAEESNLKGPLPVRHIIEKKLGLNHGRNRGIIASASEHIIYLDDDMVVETTWIEGFEEALKIGADCVVGPVEPWYEEEPADWLTPAVVASVTSPYSRKGDELKMLDAGCAYELPGCNFAVRRIVALEAGGFHPALDRSGSAMLAGGDFEFGLRLVRLGKRVVYSPKCKIRHFVSRKKLSPEGLRTRWEGLGATGRALEYLDGRTLSSWRWLHYVSGLFRTRAKSKLLQSMGRRSEAFEVELKALRIQGYLFGAPKLEVRQWPPLPLAD